MTAISGPVDGEAIVAGSPDATILAAPDGRILRWNAAAEALWGHAARDVLGGELHLIIPEKLRRAHDEGFRRAVASGSAKYAGKVLTTKSLHKDGRTLYVDLAFALLKDPHGTVVGVLATARDCTERYQAERALRGRLAGPPGAGTPAQGPASNG